MNQLINILLYFWTFITFSFLFFLSTKIKNKYLEKIWKSWKKLNFDKHNKIWDIIVFTITIVLIVIFILPFIFRIQYPILNELFYLLFWIIWSILFLTTIFIPSKKVK